MKYLFELCIFTIILFLYLHIFYQIKTSNDLEVYSIDEPSKDKLEEICNIKQPIYFKFNNDELKRKCILENLEEMYGGFDVKIRDNNDDEGIMLPFLLKDACVVLQNDKEKRFVSECNNDFLEETGVSKLFQYNDSFLRPSFVSKCNYDFLTGSLDSKTNLRYNVNYRNYYYITRGSVSVRLIPPTYSKYLYETKDYENLEFKSPINPWNVQDKYKSNFNKIKSLDIVLNEGTILYIPPYWWYSIKFNKISSICVFKYNTFMNTISISPHLLIHFLQKQNIKFNSLKKIVKTTIEENKDLLDTKPKEISEQEIQELKANIKDNLENVKEALKKDK